MRRKGIGIGVIAGFGLLLGVGANINAMNQTDYIGQEYNEILPDAGTDKVDYAEYEEAYKQLAAERGEAALKCGTFDYREEIDLRISTINASIADMKNELERGVSAEIEADLTNRIEKLTPVTEKYEAILNESTEDTDYKILAEELDAELASVYETINQ